MTEYEEDFKKEDEYFKKCEQEDLRKKEVDFLWEYCKNTDDCDKCRIKKFGLCTLNTDLNMLTDWQLSETIQYVATHLVEDGGVVGLPSGVLTNEKEKDVNDDNDNNDGESDNVNHPNHYQQRQMETIDEMVAVLGPRITIGFCAGNAWKYRSRADYKGNREEDLEKSDWYINKAMEIRQEWNISD